MLARSLSFVVLLWLAFAASPSFAQDTDSDGVLDPVDNCLTVANGPLQQTFSCNSQEDANGDGYGNACDTDVDDDGVAGGLPDVSKVLAASQSGQHDPLYDFNCDGGVGLSDVSIVLDAMRHPALAGPSGYSCAGTQPCPLGVIGSPLASTISGWRADSTSISGSVTACRFTTSPTSPQMCVQTVQVFAVGADPLSDPPFDEVIVEDGEWSVGGLDPQSIEGFVVENFVAYGSPETTALSPPIYYATLGRRLLCRMRVRASHSRAGPTCRPPSRMRAPRRSACRSGCRRERPGWSRASRSRTTARAATGWWVSAGRSKASRRSSDAR